MFKNKKHTKRYSLALCDKGLLASSKDNPRIATPLRATTLFPIACASCAPPFFISRRGFTRMPFVSVVPGFHPSVGKILSYCTASCLPPCECIAKSSDGFSFPRILAYLLKKAFLFCSHAWYPISRHVNTRMSCMNTTSTPTIVIFPSHLGRMLMERIWKREMRRATSHRATNILFSSVVGVCYVCYPNELLRLLFVFISEFSVADVEKTWIFEILRRLFIFYTKCFRKIFNDTLGIFIFK